MIRLTEKLDHFHEPAAELSLPFDTRQKTRFRAALSDGREVAVTLPRGGILRGGDLLTGPDGVIVIVQAAPEAVSTAFHKDPRMLAVGAYHLGNRHVQLQVGDSWLRYRADHVLDEMVEGIGLRVFQEQAPFEPEGGAYDGASPHLVNVHLGGGHDHHHGHHHHD